MALVNYSCSSSDSDEDININSKNIKRLKLESPKFALSTTGTADTTDHSISNNLKDDKYEGRIRSFEHERGNWATFVYIPVSLSTVEDLQDSIKAIFSNLNLKSSIDIHISLTRTVILQHHWIESFCKSIKLELSTITKFEIAFGNISIYCNDEKTRTFIGLKVDPVFNQNLIATMKKLDKVLEEYRLKKFYDNPSFHASILWCVGDNRQILQNKLFLMENIFKKLLSRYPEDFNMKISKLLCKTGNKYYVFHLK